MVCTKRDQLYEIWSKIGDFSAVLRKITDFLLSYGLYLSHRWIKEKNPLFISRYKCCGPNETNFMEFGQKLAISQLFYKK